VPARGVQTIEFGPTAFTASGANLISTNYGDPNPSAQVVLATSSNNLDSLASTLLSNNTTESENLANNPVGYSASTDSNTAISNLLLASGYTQDEVNNIFTSLQDNSGLSAVGFDSNVLIDSGVLSDPSGSTPGQGSSTSPDGAQTYYY